MSLITTFREKIIFCCISNQKLLNMHEFKKNCKSTLETEYYNLPLSYSGYLAVKKVFFGVVLKSFGTSAPHKFKIQSHKCKQQTGKQFSISKVKILQFFMHKKFLIMLMSVIIIDLTHKN